MDFALEKKCERSSPKALEEGVEASEDGIARHLAPRWQPFVGVQTVQRSPRRSLCLDYVPMLQPTFMGALLKVSEQWSMIIFLAVPQFVGGPGALRRNARIRLYGAEGKQRIWGQLAQP